MITVTKLYLRSVDLDHLDVHWEIQDFSEENILDFNFYVLRSEGPGGPFDVLAGPFQDRYSFRDSAAALLHNWRKLYYKIRVVNVLTQETFETGVAAQVPEPNLEALEIQRQEDVLWRQFAGRKCFIFPVRTFGPRCICVDKVTGRRTRGNCLNCYGVGFLGGYLTPLLAHVQIDPAPKAPGPTATGNQNPKDTSGRLLSFPPLKPNDVIVEIENERWRVTKVTPTQRLRATVHQELELHKIVPGDIEYRLPINEDITKLEPADDRLFTNPQHADKQDDIAHLLDVYRGTRGIL